jgi:excisionase family DNA binding protein
MSPKNKAVLFSPAREIEEFDPYVRLLTKDELARIIGKKRRSVEVLMAERKIPYLKIGHNVRFRLRDVEKALEKFVVKEVSK